MKKIFAVLCFTLWLSIALYAQNQPQAAKPGVSLNDQKKADQLVLETDPEIANGKVAILRGTLDTSEQRFYVKDISVMQPVCVSVYTDNAKDEVSIKLTKPSWLDVQKEDNTKGKCMCTFQFRTFGEFGIILKAAERKTNFHLFVWVGDEVKYPMNNAFVSMADYQKHHPGQAQAQQKVTKNAGSEEKNDTLTYIIIIALALIIILLIVLVMKRKITGKTHSILWLAICVGFAPTLKAQSYERQSMERFGNDLSHHSTLQQSADRFADVQRLGQAISGIGTNKEHPFLSEFFGYRTATRQTVTGVHAGIIRGGGNISSAASVLHDFAELWPLLHPDDHDSEPNYTPDGSPEMPTICDSMDNPGACGNCFRESYEHLNNSRAILEQLKAIYARTKKLKKKSIAFGDNVSGMTGVAAFAWQKERGGIEQTYKTFTTHYKAKCNELITGLHTALMEIDACEDEHGLPDWYNRFGFMYYDFMKVRYGLDSEDE